MLEVSGEITQGEIRIQTVTNFGLLGKETFLSKNLKSIFSLGM